MIKNFYVRRAVILIICFTGVMYGFVAFFLGTVSGLLPGTEAAAQRAEYQNALLRSRTLESVFYGRSADGSPVPLTEPTGPARSGRVLYPSLHRVLGYSSSRWGSSGLRGSELLKPLLYQPESKKSEVLKGPSVYTTLDPQLSELAQQLLSQVREGAVVVLNANTGAVLSAVSIQNGTPFDANAISENDEALWEQYRNLEGFLLPGFAAAQYPSGSTMKLVTAAYMLENGIAEDYNDTGEERVGYAAIHNAGKRSYGRIGLQQAVVDSVNTYFANKVQYAPACFLRTAHAFGFDEKTWLPDLNYTVRPALDPLAATDSAVLARVGFGYSNTASPLLLACNYAALAASREGEMPFPYFLERVAYDENGKKQKPLYEAERGTLGQISAGLPRLRECFAAAAESYGLHSGRFAELYAKTGTSENADGTQNIWMAASMRDTATGDAYAIVVAKFHLYGTVSSHSLADPVNLLIARLEQRAVAH